MVRPKPSSSIGAREAMASSEAKLTQHRNFMQDSLSSAGLPPYRPLQAITKERYQNRLSAFGKPKPSDIPSLKPVQAEVAESRQHLSALEGGLPNGDFFFEFGNASPTLPQLDTVPTKEVVAKSSPAQKGSSLVKADCDIEMDPELKKVFLNALEMGEPLNYDSDVVPTDDDAVSDDTSSHDDEEMPDNAESSADSEDIQEEDDDKEEDIQAPTVATRSVSTEKLAMVKTSVHSSKRPKVDHQHRLFDPLYDRPVRFGPKRTRRAGEALPEGKLPSIIMWFDQFVLASTHDHLIVGSFGKIPESSKEAAILPVRNLNAEEIALCEKYNFPYSPDGNPDNQVTTKAYWSLRKIWDKMDSKKGTDNLSKRDSLVKDTPEKTTRKRSASKRKSSDKAGPQQQQQEVIMPKTTMPKPTEAAQPPPTKRARTHSGASASSSSSSGDQKMVHAAVQNLRKADKAQRDAFFSKIPQGKLGQIWYFAKCFEQYYGESLAQVDRIPIPEGDSATAMKNGAFALAAKLRFMELPEEEEVPASVDSWFPM